ncbi:MAG: hypothetical protein ACOZNI_17760 [Myxococcota bacterium]
MLLFTLAGCPASPPAAYEAVDPAEAVAAIDENLARLEALEIVEVGALVNEEAEQAWSCYGECPGYSEEKVAAEEERQAVRLAVLADVAEGAAEGETVADDAADVEANLARLRALEIVEIGELIDAEPQNNPDCYNLPCPEDEQAAAALDAARASALARIADAAEGL